MNFRHATATSRGLLPCCALLMAALAGCAHEPSDLERAMGESVRQARAQQALQPSPGQGAGTPIVTDGVIAVHGVDRYHQTWVRPPAPMTVLNIQAGGAAPGGQAALPR